MPIDPRFLAESGLEVFSGNELLVKGAFETDGGVHLMTGYPGSPIAGFFDVLSDLGPLLKEKGVRDKVKVVVFDAEPVAIEQLVGKGDHA